MAIAGPPRPRRTHRNVRAEFQSENYFPVTKFRASNVRTEFSLTHSLDWRQVLLRPGVTRPLKQASHGATASAKHILTATHNIRVIKRIFPLHMMHVLLA